MIIKYVKFIEGHWQITEVEVACGEEVI